MAYTNEEDDFGGALTGQRTPGTGPLQNIMAPAAQPAGGGFLSDPADRAALLSIGLQMMQPLAFGQTVGGHIGQAIGAGGEASSAREAEDLKRRRLEDAAAQAEARTELARQRLEDQERRGTGKLAGALTANQQFLQGHTLRTEERQQKIDEARAKQEAENNLLAQATLYDKRANDAATPSSDPIRQKYAGKDAYAIREMLRAEQGAAAAPAAGGKPKTIKQGGYTYTLQPDGSYQ